VEETGYIEVKIEGRVNGKPLQPMDMDIADIKEMISDIESFLFPSRGEKADRPHISYKLEEGSARHLFFLPLASVITFQALTKEISHRGSADFLDYKRADIIEKIQKRARESGYSYSFIDSVSQSKTLEINKDTHFYNVAPDYILTELILYGEIINEGGQEPNFHIVTKEFGKLTVAATKQQLLEGEKRLYQVYGVRVSGKQKLTDGKPFDLKLEDYIEYNPQYDPKELEILSKRASKNWADVPDVDAWLEEIRA
jgi:hypothetical protein